MSEVLAQPLTLPNGTRLPNRMAKAAMSERLGTADGAPSSELVQLYRQWAEGGVGLLITGNVMVDRRALGERGNVIVEDDGEMQALRAWARAASLNGTKVIMQINHPGRQTPRFVTRQPVAPSAVPMRGTGGTFAKPRALGVSEIDEIIARFAKTASLAEEAGFHGVQIHGAHGYLVSQFLSPLTNRREDEWGGTPKRRRRFLVEIVPAVRAAVSPDFIVSVKLNSADFQRGGFTEEESMAVVAALEEEGIDLLEISGGTYEASVMFQETIPQRESSRRREAFFMDYALKVRGRTRLPLMLTGGFRTVAAMDDAVGSAAVDVVGLARPLALEPDLPGRILSAEAEAARPVQLATGSKKLDGVLQGAWYGAQLRRMGRGEKPDAGMSRWSAAWRYLRHRYGAPVDGSSSFDGGGSHRESEAVAA